MHIYKRITYMQICATKVIERNSVGKEDEHKFVYKINQNNNYTLRCWEKKIFLHNKKALTKSIHIKTTRDNK